MFIYNLPYMVRSNLVTSLNAGDIWKDLAGGRLGYSHLEIQRFSEARFRAGDSPADALLTHWGQRNGTVEEMFKHLHAMGLFQCMYLLKENVPKSMHCYLVTSAKPEPEAMMCARPPPPPLPLQRSDAWLKNNLNSPHDSEKKIMNKVLDLPTDIFVSNEETRERNVACARGENTALKRIDRGTSDRVLYLAPNIQSPNVSSAAGPSRSDMHSSLSRLKQRVPSGVPLPGDEVFLNNIPFHALKAACSNFDRDIPGVLLGHGGFGEVFRGKLNGQDVAVKRILEEKRFQIGSDAYQRCINQAITELQTLHSYPAENILPLMAISFDPSFQTDPCLVYQFMPHGSVSDRLKQKQGTPPLAWDKRANIALGTARGLMHLHANNIIHGDIKSGNILLDRHFEPKIGDFGLARGGPENSEASFKMVSIVKGTQAYLPEDYIRSHQLTAAVDTFCFGIFMFELVSAKSPSYPIPDCPDNLRVRDVMLSSESPEPWVDRAIPPSYWSQLLFYVGKDCAKRNRKSRPLMKTVLEAFDRLLQQPTSAMALQSYYDEQKIRNTPRSATFGDNAEQQEFLVPTVPGKEENTLTESATGTSSAQTNNQQISASIIMIDEPSLPNLSKFLSSQRDNGQQQQDEISLPDLSLLRVSNDVDNRLSEIEEAATKAASYDIL